MSSTPHFDSADSFPRKGRLAGIDYGSVRIGVAVTDPEQRLASPLENYTRRETAADAAWLKGLAADERLVGFVIGLPVHTDGNESRKSSEVREFGKWVADLTGLPVRYFDERYTSAQALTCASGSISSVFWNNFSAVSGSRWSVAIRASP